MNQQVIPRLEWSWPVTVDRKEAEHWVKKRLLSTTGLRLSLFHHPMAGAEFAWKHPTRTTKPSGQVSVLVDLVGGRAYATDPWARQGLMNANEERKEHGTAETDATSDSSVADPIPRIDLEEAALRAQEIASSVVLRQRRAASKRRLVQTSEPLAFGKPNWWITGEHRGRRLEMILDAVTGRHYIFSA